MEYANITYPLIPTPLRRKLQRLQNRAVRIIYNNNNEQHDLETLHILSKLTPIEQRASKQLTLLMYRRAYNPEEYPLLPQTGPTRKLAPENRVCSTQAKL